MKTSRHLLSLILAGALPVAALAAEPMNTPAPAAATGEVAPMFKELDRDHDGQVSKSEAKRSAEIQKRFDTLDLDRNGKLSVTEWNTAEQQKREGKI